MSEATVEASRDQVDALYDAAGDHELALLDDLVVRAGLRWRCERPERTGGRSKCGWMNWREDERCGGCGAPRAVAAPEAPDASEPAS